MGARCLVLALVVGCYSPTLSPGSPCTEKGTCPGDLVCDMGRCVTPGGPGPIDSPPLVPDATDATFEIDALGDAFIPPDSTTGTVWAAPSPLGGGVNTPATETDPSITNDRLTLVFIRNVAADEEIFMSTRTTTAEPWGVATAVTALNSTSLERSPEIGDDGQAITFTSNRSGNFDVYVSFKVGSTWSAPVVVTELSGTGIENDVAISPDRLTAFVTRGSSPNRRLFRSTRSSVFQVWGAPTQVTEVTVDVGSPSLTNNGATLYFHANAVRDLFTSQKVGSVYPAPSPVAELNTAGRDAAPFVLQGNSYMVFEREGSIFETTR